MIRRFHIEDLIAQDETGVIFRAVDKETGHPVAVRRFFPFGADGGGLQPEEQCAYDIALNRLAGLSHPALRAVICGGCDPVDGMPFIATEWIEGDPLGWFVAQGPLPADVATELIAQALEVSEVLSQVLADEAVWVETDLQTIIVGSEESGRGFTFWISPLKWLGGQEQPRGLGSIVTLTEKVMGWQGRNMNDQEGRGLAGWLKWLRHTSDSISLHEARETLAASVGVEPPPPPSQLLAQATRPPARRPKPPSSKLLWITNSCLALVAAGLGSWVLLRQQNPNSPPILALPPLQVTTAEPAEPAAAESAMAASEAEEAQTVSLAEQQSAARKNGGVIHWTSRELLLLNDKREVVVEGVLEDIGQTKTRSYLLFGKPPKKADPRGTVMLKSAADDLSQDALNPLIGKAIRLRGTVDVQQVFGTKRPEIIIEDRGDIEVLPNPGN